MCFYGWEFLNQGHHATSVTGFKYCGSGEKAFLIFQVISRDHIFKGLSDFTGGSLFNFLRSWGSRDIRYLIRQVTRCLEGCVAPFVSTYHFAKFNGYRPYHSRGITSLICHMTLQDHLIRQSCNFVEGSSSSYIPPWQVQQP